MVSLSYETSGRTPGQSNVCNEQRSTTLEEIRIVTMTDGVLAVGVGIADVRHDPDPTSELVTQALMNVPAIIHETSGDWTHVTLSDYEGWMRTSDLEEPIAKAYCKIGEHCRTPL